jgi:hypothetical protein
MVLSRSQLQSQTDHVAHQKKGHALEVGFPLAKLAPALCIITTEKTKKELNPS